ncbi:disease resistance protein [Senna tora]|uniref:Disease resistance protein n=1 Tax=Senna tora TaxID=362788 RepID=A0A834T5E6_9FABA|nr:disease resistance protein [Senna tora]
MALSLSTSSSSSITKPFSKLSSSAPQRRNGLINCGIQRRNKVALVKCENSSEDPSAAEKKLSPKGTKKLQIGSPIIVVEAPKMIKTAASIPCLRANSGLVKAGDVGRIVSRKPKDVWAVRLSVGTYLLDGKYFKPLELAEYN